MAASTPQTLELPTAIHGNGTAHPDLANIIQALEAIHTRTTTNEIRKQASEFLELQKHEKSAVQNGFYLAAERSHSPLVRHFGLSLLEHVLKHRLSELTPGQIGHLRGLILGLAQEVQVQDLSYIRNKLILLWVEIAKRTWALDWLGMDESLLQLWNGSLIHKEFVLGVLEAMSDDVFHHEDTASSLRGTDLNRALVEICTPYAVFKEVYPDRANFTELRCGPEGWLFRITVLLNDCVQNLHSAPEVRTCAQKALATLRSLLTWNIPLAIASSQCVQAICGALTANDESILMLAVEALHALYGRTHYDIQEFEPLLLIIYDTDRLELLRKLYEWSIVDAENIIDSKYTTSKKLSELLSYLAGFLEEKSINLSKKIDQSYFFSFLTNVLRHPSLILSIPVLHSWSRLLICDEIGNPDIVTNFIGPLLEICTQRLVRYEAFPENSEDPTILFLNEDIDTLPDRHAFVGNYRRYCGQVIEVIVQKRPHDAIPHILSGVDIGLNNIYNGTDPFNPATFHKHTVAALRADTQFTVTEYLLKGYNKWVENHGNDPQRDEQQRSTLESLLESWALSLLQRQFVDPVIKQRVIRLSVDFSAKALRNKPSYALKVLEHILTTHAVDNPEFPLYSEAVRELYSLSTYEVRRLATRYADYFSTFYDILEQKVQEMQQRSTEDQPQMELSSVLLIVMHRAKDVDPHLRQARLRSFIEPLRQAWANDQFRQIISTFQGFCEVFALDQVHPYLQARQAQNIEDWSVITLDEEGKRIQSQMNSKFQSVPLRNTKTLLAVSTEKLKPSDPPYQVSCELWKDMIPLILPSLLQLVGHAHAFHNPDNWAGLPLEMRPIVGRILTDRFWQAGISAGSREDFYAKIATSKRSLEGFSSSVRGKVRAVREACYSILFSMSRLGEHFYGFQELSIPLSQALYSNATSLSSHQFSVLLNISRCLIDDCPPQSRGHFLPPMMSSLFVQLDKKITTEWDVIERRRAGMVDDDLTEEMKEESILRQLTYSAVIMVASLLDPNKEGPGNPDSNNRPTQAEEVNPANLMRTFILSTPQILEPVVVFCTHALRIHDTRSCSIITRVLRSILSSFLPTVDTPTAASIREFISTQVLKACITSVHEPYFVDMQKDLAQLIASIWILYGPRSPTPRSVMLSLPGITEARAIAAEEALMKSSSTRIQKAVVLDFLEGLRGVSISEQGKIGGARAGRRKERSIMQARYMTTEMEGQEGGKVDINNGPDLTGVADMFS
ncbi:exportin-5 [Coccidioides immitis RS]|uniref:Exportin-5 n=2 Tax=Coccidioides immitis TaxID=5501 RepID=J3K3X5_COCIM|nr:exportin-5 [Coccidioides immitis RS]EAS28945.3 exportin-5 [Coccidioides immitis RS]